MADVVPETLLATATGRASDEVAAALLPVVPDVVGRRFLDIAEVGQ